MKNNSIILFLFFLIACSPQENKWKDATAKNTIGAYEDYLQGYPAGKYVAIAKDSIMNLVCDSAIISQSSQLLKNCISQYPNSKRISEVKLCLETMEWETVKLSNRLDTIQSFINKYPNSKFINESKKLLEKVKYTPSMEILENCLLHAVKSHFGSNDYSAKYKVYKNKVFDYDTKLNYLRVNGAGWMKSFSGEYTAWGYFRVKTDGKGNWSAVLINDGIIY